MVLGHPLRTRGRVVRLDLNNIVLLQDDGVERTFPRMAMKRFYIIQPLGRSPHLRPCRRGQAPTGASSPQPYTRSARGESADRITQFEKRLGSALPIELRAFFLP